MSQLGSQVGSRLVIRSPSGFIGVINELLPLGLSHLN